MRVADTERLHILVIKRVEVFDFGGAFIFTFLLIIHLNDALSDRVDFFLREVAVFDALAPSDFFVVVVVEIFVVVVVVVLGLVVVLFEPLGRGS